MEKKIYISATLEKYFRDLKHFILKAVRKKIVPTVVKKISLDQEKYCPAKNNVVFVVDRKDMNCPHIKKCGNLLVLNKEASRYDASRNILYLYYPKKNTIEETAAVIELFSSLVYFRSRYYDTQKSLDAFDSISEYARETAISKDQIQHAQEQALKFAGEELKEKDRVIMANENVMEYSQNEQIMTNSVLRAWEMFYETTREELKELRQEFHAGENAAELGRQELIQKDQTLKAMDAVADLSRTELIEARQEFEAEEGVLEFNRLEAMNEAKKIENLKETDIQRIIGNKKIWSSLNESSREDLVLIIKNLFKVLLKKKNIIASITRQDTRN